MVLHRITSCHAVADLINWYHDVAVRVAPTVMMAKTLVDARKAEVLWAAGSHELWEAHCLPFLRHLLSPAAACPPADTAARHLMLKAARMFFSTVLDCINDLPTATTVGPVPVFPFLPADIVLPGRATGVIDVTYWDAVERHLPPVPQSDQPGHEAEAPWVRLARRVSR